ncbi:hypothetical protein NFI96_025518 [Prochilodus magdalenae]|nr:hypothetical protein NFI96_025518 [Prochilodus magdalenae]
MEEGALQKERELSRDTQQALENLAKRRAQLKEEIEGIQEQRKQEGQLLLSLQEEQEELEQTVHEYEEELQRAKDELQHLHEEIGKTRAKVEDAHGRMGPLKHSISETYAEITETKERLGELIAEMIAIEACVPEITCHQVGEPLSLDLDNSSGEEEEDAEECYDHVYEETKERLGELIAEMIAIEACVPEITCHQVGEPLSLDLDNSSGEEEEDAEECYDHVYEEVTPIKQIPAEKEQEQNVESLEKLQRSAENLKSSGSSSFTEITLTEVKEEDASPRSNTPQHMDSPDLEEEDFEIIQSLDVKPISQANSREFDFFHPDPFVDHDVFGDDRFPKVDMTEFLSGDPFKGTDPFASDILFNDVADGHFSQDDPVTEESNAKEQDPLSLDPESTWNDEHVDAAHLVAHVSAGANCSQSIDSGMFEQNVPDPCDSERYTPYSDICPDVEINITASQELDSLEQNNTLPTESDLAASSRLDDEGRFDPIHCEHNDSHAYVSSDSSTVNSSFDGDFGTFTGMEHPEGELEAEAGPSYVRRNQALYGLQRIDTSSYTSFPLSPEDYAPGPDVPASSDKEESVQVVNNPFSFRVEHDEATELKPDTEDAGSTGNPSPICQESSDPCDFDQANQASHSPESADTDAYDHKFGDIYFFTVRLDPGSPDASPGSADASDRKKSECDHTSPESNDTDEFDCGAPEDEDPKQYSLEAYAEESFDKEESPIETEQPLSPEPNEPMQSESEMKSPIEDFPYPGHEDQSTGLDVFDHSDINVDGNDALKTITEITESVPAHTADTNPEKSNPEPAGQYLISPVSGGTGLATTAGYKLCAHNPFSLDSGSVEHCDNLESNPETLNTRNYVVQESKLKDFDPFDPVPTDNATHKFEVSSVNSTSTDCGRLDSGYHENSGLDPFSPAPTHAYPSTDLAPIFLSPNRDMPSPGILDLEAPDPFSPESNNTLIFDSEICNPSTNDGVLKDSGHAYPASSDILGDSFSGSEFDSFDPFSPVPHTAGGSYNHCSMDILVPGLVQNHSKSDGATRSSSCDSGVSHSPQLHCGSGQNREDSHPPPNSEAHSLGYLPNCSTKGSFFESASSPVTDAGSFESNTEKPTKQDSSGNVTAMAELAEIDFFCSELSKMVASRSSDSVQQSVAEMLFGSNPDTAKFYPWDFENSNMVVNEPLSPEDDFDNSNKLSKDLQKLEAGTRSHRSSDLLGSTAGHSLDEAEKPSLL